MINLRSVFHHINNHWRWVDYSLTLGWLWWGCTPPLVGVSSQDQWMVKTPSRLMHWIPPFWGSMTSYFCPKTKQSINRSFSKSKFVEIFLSLKSVFLLCASVCVCMDLSQWKSRFSNFRNYVARIDWGLLTEWRIYRVALRNGDHIGPENWGPKRCNHPSEIGYLGQEADLVTDWFHSLFLQALFIGPNKSRPTKNSRYWASQAFSQRQAQGNWRIFGVHTPLVIVTVSVKNQSKKNRKYWPW